MSVSTVPGRHARMLRILRQLQSGGGLNAEELADQLDVCRRTIFRDLNMMRQAGVEFYFDEQLDCYRLLPQEHLVAMPALDQEELTTLVAAVHLSVLRELPECSDLLRQSISKLLACSPRHVQHHATRVIKSCCVHAADPPASVPAAPIVHLILAAISQRKVLRVKIVDVEAGQEVVTRFSPYQMVAAVDKWQVVGRSSHHRRVCTFEPRQMKQPEMTDEIYAIPRGFQASGCMRF